MADPKAPRSPLQKLAAALDAGPEAEKQAWTNDTFTLHRGESILDIAIVQGAPPCLTLRAHEEEAAPSTSHGRAGADEGHTIRKNVLARARARQVYPALTVRRITSLDSMNALLGFRCETRTGDASFDRAVAIETELADDVLSRAFGSAEARKAAIEILDAGFTLHFEERALRADAPSPTDSHFTPATAGRVADALATLIAHVPRLDPASFTKRAPIGRVVIGTIVVTGLLAAAALAPGTLDDSGVPIRAIPRPVFPMPQMIPGIALGTVLFALTYLGLRWLIKRRNTSTDLPLVMAILVVMWTLGVGALDAANRLLDDELETHDAKVTGKDTNKSRKSGAVTEWLLFVPSWMPGTTQLELSVDAGLHRTIRNGDTLRISLHPGFFGWPWGAVVERIGGAAPNTNRIPGLPDDLPTSLPGDEEAPSPPGR